MKLFPEVHTNRSSQADQPDNHRRGTRRIVCGLHKLALIAAVTASGCQAGGQKPVRLPVQHSVRSDQLLVLSDVKLDTDHPLIADLVDLRQQLADTLNLPTHGREVVVYLFENELSYRQYLSAAYPGLPPRRAYFVGTPQELAVYTFWGERIQEDLRHEFTHGLLHARLKTVPLWLDEGLAEYFEVAGPTAGGINSDYGRRLTAALSNGWRPDVERLEQLQHVQNMQRIDCQEAWAWVHCMLHSTPTLRQVLLDYLQDLRSTSQPGPLSKRLRRAEPELDQRLLNYVASLTSTRNETSQPSQARATLRSENRLPVRPAAQN